MLRADKFEELETYLAALDAILATCPHAISDSQLETSLFDQTSRMPELALDTEGHERVDTDTTRNYEFQMIADDYVARWRQNAGQSELIAAYKACGKLMTAATSAAGGADPAALGTVPAKGPLAKAPRPRNTDLT